MIKLIKKLFQRKPKPLLIDNTYQIVPAFELRGTTYYMHADPMNTATGRGLTSMVFIEEVIMRCSVSYLRSHVEAMEELLSDPQRINVTTIARLNWNLKERINMLAALPDHVYKLASVVYFTKEESPYRYDRTVNEKKIAEWKKSNLYDFFIQGHLKTLMPSLALPETGSKKFLEVSEMISNQHLKILQEVLSKKASTTDISN